MRFFSRNTILPINIFSLVVLYNLHVRPTELTNSMYIYILIYYLYPIMTNWTNFYTEYCLQIYVKFNKSNGATNDYWGKKKVICCTSMSFYSAYTIVLPHLPRSQAFCLLLLVICCRPHCEWCWWQALSCRNVLLGQHWCFRGVCVWEGDKLCRRSRCLARWSAPQRSIAAWWGDEIKVSKTTTFPVTRKMQWMGGGENDLNCPWLSAWESDFWSH